MPEEQLNTMATSNHIGNTGEETSPLLLSKWIHHAVTTVDLSHITNNTEATNYLGSNPQLWPANIRLSMALCSEEYLMSALNVAYSLADQICLLEGGGGVLNNGDINNNYCSSEADSSSNNDNNVRMMLPSLPPAGSSWTDSIQIHLSTTTTTTNGLHEINNGSPTNKVTAKFSSTTMNNNKEGGGGNIEDYMQRLYSLGVVFYEIFSGGERPINVVSAPTAPTAPTGATTTTETLTSSLSQEEISENNITLDLFDDHDEIIGGDGSGGPPTIGLLGKGGDALGLEGLIFDDVPDAAADDDYNHLLRHGDDEAADNDGVNNNGGIPRKRQITQQNHGNLNNNSKNSNTMSSVSIVEPLKAKGIPVSLCDMIVNMMDCTYGTLRGQDAYHSMMEVRDDLRLMLDRPDLYLYDQDMGRLSSTGLQFGGSSFGRNAELATIKDAYELYNVTINLYV